MIETRDWNQQILTYETLEKKIPVHLILTINGRVHNSYFKSSRYIYCYKAIYNYYINYLNANSLKIIITNIHIDTRACTFKLQVNIDLITAYVD